MIYRDIVNGPQHASAIVQGCMRMPRLSVDEAAAVIRNDYELGINYFDHADIYGRGQAEERFGEAFPKTGLKREDIYVQSKCGIHSAASTFDWSKEYIVSSVEGILSRLKMDYLDALLLHRPDILFDPEEVADAFDTLHQAGKVRYFGVSNTTPMEMELLKKYMKQPLVLNQLQFSLEQSQLVDQAIYLNNKTTDMSFARDDSVLDYCRLHDITIQAWSPLQHGMISGSFIDNPDFPEINAALAASAEAHGLSKAAIAMAWILRHPAKMQAIAGTMNPQHMAEIAAGTDFKMSREEWYKIYLGSGKFLP